MGSKWEKVAPTTKMEWTSALVAAFAALRPGDGALATFQAELAASPATAHLPRQMPVDRE